MALTKQPELAHLQATLSAASQPARGVRRISLEQFQAICIAFLAVVDLFLIAEKVADDVVQEASDWAALALTIARGVDGSSVSVFDFWQSFREQLIGNND